MSSRTERQKVVFTQFLNSILPEDLKIPSPDDLASSISSGLLILRLLEILIKQTYNRDVRFVDELVNVQNPNIYQKLENVRIALQYLKDEEGIDMVNMDAQSIVDENEKIVLGLVWRIINHYHVSRKAARKATEEKEQLLQSVLTEEKHVEVVNELTELEKKYADVLQWVNDVLSQAGFDGSVKNLTTDWSDSQLLYNLIVAISGSDDKEEMKDLSGDELFQAIIDYANEKLNVPKLISVEDFQDPDKQILSTYLAYFRDFWLTKERSQILEQNQVDMSDITNMFGESLKTAPKDIKITESPVKSPEAAPVEEAPQEMSPQSAQSPQAQSSPLPAHLEDESPMIRIQKERREKLMEQAAEFRKKREELRQKSKEMKEKFLQDRKERIEQKHKWNVDEEKRQSEYLNMANDNVWESVAKYCNLTQTAPQQPKSVERYQKLIISLKNKA